MTREELRAGFEKGLALNDMLPVRNGQDCTIYKADRFRTDDEIIYIPDMELNEIVILGTPSPVDYDHIISHCYTGADFIEQCNGDESLARRLFEYVDWQHPVSALDEMEDPDE